MMQKMQNEENAKDSDIVTESTISRIPDSVCSISKDESDGIKVPTGSRRDYSQVSRDEFELRKRLRQGDSDTNKETRKPKRKVACLLGYCGTGYHGMQLTRNPGTKTIESTLFAAFVSAGAISQDNSDDPRKVSLTRAARTDKGVHAACNVISLKLIVDEPNLVQIINDNLPPSIRVWKILRSLGSFNPRGSCDSRIYEYSIPSATFLPPSPGSSFAKIMEYNRGQLGGTSIALGQEEGRLFWLSVSNAIASIKLSDVYVAIRDDDADIGQFALDSTIPEDEKKVLAARHKREKLLKHELLTRKKAYRMGAERLKYVRDSFSNFIGTKNFHNYTVGKGYNEANAWRLIRSIVIDEPFLINGTEWLSIKIHGQSFMLHQIRKMVAMVFLVVRTGCTHARMNQSFTSKKVNIPKAPSLGLLLEKPIFEVYNKKATGNGKEPIETDSLQLEILDFKMKHIYDKLYAEEEEQNTFDSFLTAIDAYGTSGALNFLLSDNYFDIRHESAQIEYTLAEEDVEESSNAENEG